MADQLSRSLTDLYRRWDALWRMPKREDESDDDFNARLDAVSDERRSLERQIAESPAATPGDISLKLRVLRECEGDEFRYIGSVDLLNGIAADLERLDLGAPERRRGGQ